MFGHVPDPHNECYVNIVCRKYVLITDKVTHTLKNTFISCKGRDNCAVGETGKSMACSWVQGRAAQHRAIAEKPVCSRAGSGERRGRREAATASHTAPLLTPPPISLKGEFPLHGNRNSSLILGRACI